MQIFLWCCYYWGDMRVSCTLLHGHVAHNPHGAFVFLKYSLSPTPGQLVLHVQFLGGPWVYFFTGVDFLSDL